MPQLPATYANTVNFRLTPQEFVLEFGSFFPDRPGQTPPSDFKPDVRVVLPIGAVEGMVNALSKAVAQRQQTQKEAQQKQAPGFKQAPPASKE